MSHFEAPVDLLAYTGHNVSTSPAPTSMEYDSSDEYASRNGNSNGNVKYSSKSGNGNGNGNWGRSASAPGIAPTLTHSPIAGHPTGFALRTPQADLGHGVFHRIVRDQPQRESMQLSSDPRLRMQDPRLRGVSMSFSVQGQPEEMALSRGHTPEWLRYHCLYVCAHVSCQKTA